MLNYTFKGMQGRVSILAVETDNTDRNSLIITIPLQTIRHILQIKNKHLRIDKHKENKMRDKEGSRIQGSITLEKSINRERRQRRQS